ncbi:MAG: choice-of-anchor D domain-containing protein, partial [Flavicella sp.]|nr:choice-of-anchor D domain-containing protein [Flavicella sp.]
MKKITPLAFLSVLLMIGACSSSDSGEIATKTFTTELSETTLSFGNVEVTNTAEETFTVTNTGTEEISISNITTPEGFSVTPSSGSIAAGNSQTFTVAFTPTTISVFSGNMSITSNS